VSPFATDAPTAIGSSDTVPDLCAVISFSSSRDRRIVLNFLHDTTKSDRAFTPRDFARLRTLKLQYDPDNAFGRTPQHRIRARQPRRVNGRFHGSSGSGVSSTATTSAAAAGR
jgi:Berberine and berberine like